MLVLCHKIFAQLEAWYMNFTKAGQTQNGQKLAFHFTFYILRDTKTPDFTFLFHEKLHCEAKTVHEEITTEKRTSTIPFYLQQNIFIFHTNIKQILFWAGLLSPAILSDFACRRRLTQCIQISMMVLILLCGQHITQQFAAVLQNKKCVRLRWHVGVEICLWLLVYPGADRAFCSYKWVLYFFYPRLCSSRFSLGQPVPVVTNQAMSSIWDQLILLSLSRTMGHWRQ